MLESNDDLFDSLVGARDNRSVLKLRLLNHLPEQADRMIFAFEGDDDKIIYGSWITRVSENILYEPFICNGKKNARAISCILAEDKGELSERVAIFVDHDFDGLNEFCNAKYVFVTDHYSVENYIVCDDVMDHVLRTYFPLEGEAHLRAQILSHFDSMYKKFLRYTREANFRLFVAAKKEIGRPDRFDVRLSNLVEMSLENLTRVNEEYQHSMPLEREPSEEEYEELRDQFDRLVPSEHYRGKFAFYFFRKILNCLCDACRHGHPKFFEGRARPNVRQGELSLGNFAARSRLPNNLVEFLRNLPL